MCPSPSPSRHSNPDGEVSLGSPSRPSGHPTVGPRRRPQPVIMAGDPPEVQVETCPPLLEAEPRRRSSWTDLDSEVEEDHRVRDVLCHPLLDADLRAVRTLYSDRAVSVRAHPFIDGLDVQLHVDAGFLDAGAAKAWRINPSEPIVVRLHLSLSQYLDGPAPSVHVFQPSNPEGFSLGKQLQSILTTFISKEWKHLTNEGLVQRQKVRPGTTKKFQARLGILVPHWRRPGELQEVAMRGQAGGPHSTDGHVKKKAELPPPAAEHLMELPFSSRRTLHCKAVPTLQHGFLVQVMRYAAQRVPTLNEYCVLCDERHLFQNGPLLKPSVCTRELCVFSFHTLGVMSGATEEVATGAEVVDLLVAMCGAALQSPRKSVIFQPYPCVVDPRRPGVLAFSPRRRSYDRLRTALDSVLLVRRTAQGPSSELKRQMDRTDPLAYPLLQWILSSNRSHIVKLPPHRRLRFMHTSHQFLLVSSPPSKEARFRSARKLYGSTFAFHGSHIENWHSILRNGLVSASYTRLQLHGAAYGKGIYLSPVSGVSFGYSEMGKGWHQIPTKEELIRKCGQTGKVHQVGGPAAQPTRSRFLQSRNLNCIALCEVIASKDLQKHGDIWMCPIADHVCTRFLFVYEDGRVGDLHINTQEAAIHKEILDVIARQPS